ncbi:tyrosine-type recombinase/integrase [Enterocloster bolteae]|uniref:tyrosine-type recombinase/integrase n=1 Tax=Enterocloster bolteae TaxID=208479 RepID=UPI0021095447|nr:tyrosine-type recombinase/integrase [Enterocloster bolteae]MCQ5144530.1 tyrosine-type recombinase/integrase [Enterocloster bolteae]
MRQYSVESVDEGTVKYYYIRNCESMEIVLPPSKYLKHKIKSNRSPNTVKRAAFAICYYLEYLKELPMEITEVCGLDFERQNEHFVNFLHWLKAGNHTQDNSIRNINNGTCNAYLEDVFRFYLFAEAEYEQFHSLKVLSYNYHMAANAVGVQKKLRYQSFKGYLKAEERKVRPAEHEEITTILQSCTNCRDQLLLLMIAETGFRIGEILGVNYIHDIDYQHHMVGVYFREDNENEARAKNAEYRKAKISDETYEFLMYYLAEYRELLQHQRFLFITITGKTAGQPLKVDSVYDMLNRMEKKTGIDLTPHMLRRYFANMRRKAGWRLELIQQALGHKHIGTTIKYLNIVDDELLEASEEFYTKHSAMYGVEKLL